MRRSRDLFAGCDPSDRGSRPTLMAVAASAAGMAAILAMFVGGEYLQRLRAYRAERSAAGLPNLPPVGLLDPVRNIVLNTIPEVPRPGAAKRMRDSGLPVYDLKLASKDLRVLQQTAERVTARVISDGVPLDYVSAQFLMDGLWRPIQVKLRGLYSMHYLKRRPSLRLKFPRDRLFEGKDQINLSDPYDKGLTIDVTTNRELARLGVLTWDTRFVWLRVNGELVGLFQEIEQFGRSLVDRQGRSEGYILAGHGQLFGKEGTGYDIAMAALKRLDACGISGPGAPDNSTSDAGCDWALVDELLDTDRWAWVAAYTAVLGSRHAWYADNLRLFWDPARGRFEPIPWDYYCYRIDPRLHPDGEVAPTGFGAALNAASEFRRLRDRRLWRVLTERIEPMIADADQQFADLRDALLLDTRHLGMATDEARQTEYGRTLRHNRRILMDLFRSSDVRASVWARRTSGPIVSVANQGKAFVEVTGFRVRVSADVSVHALPRPVLVDGAWRGVPGRRVLVLDLPPGGELVGLVVRNEVTGETLPDEAVTVARGEGPEPDPEPGPVRPSFQVALDNVRIDGKRVTFGPGTVRLDRNLETPRTHTVIFSPGLRLEMGDGASLMILGDLSSVGTRELPIRIYGAGPRGVWGGLLVQGTRERPSSVRVEHTTLRGGSGGENRNTRFSGPFAVHDGVVLIRNSEFLDSTVEDGINLKYCAVEIRDSLFRGSKSDAVDLDFCTGSFARNTVAAVGGDGLDLSGSRILIEDTRVIGCGDKGHSIGEHTFAVVRGSVISSCYTGIAVKDLSRAVIRDSRLSGLEIGLALYVKKPTFGPSAASIENVVMRDVATEVVHDDACVLDRSAPGPSDPRGGHVLAARLVSP